MLDVEHGARPELGNLEHLGRLAIDAHIGLGRAGTEDEIHDILGLFDLRFCSGTLSLYGGRTLVGVFFELWPLDPKLDCRLAQDHLVAV